MGKKIYVNIAHLCKKQGISYLTYTLTIYIYSPTPKKKKKNTFTKWNQTSLYRYFDSFDCLL